MQEPIKIYGFIKAVHESGIKLQTKEDIEGQWYNAVGKAKEYIKPELKGTEVEITILNNKTFSYIKVIKERTIEENKPVGSCVDRDTIIVRQNSLTHADSILAFVLPLLLKDNELDLNSILEIHHNIALSCEKWIWRKEKVV